MQLKPYLVFASILMITFGSNQLLFANTTLVANLLQAEKKLVEKRISILKKSNLKLSQLKGDDFRPQANSIKQANRTYEADISALMDKHKALQDIEDQFLKNQLSTNNAVARVSSLNSNCKLGECLKVLGVMNRDLAKQIADIAVQVTIQDWDKFSLSKSQNDDGTKSLQNSDENLNAASNLYLKKWACERSLASVQTQVSLDATKLGECFTSILLVVGDEQNVYPKITNGQSGLLNPNDNFLKRYNEQHERLTKKIMAHSDYTLSPAALFKECAKEEGASLREALKLCYEVLRHNRARPDFKRKLVDIRGDRNAGGDNAGDWYHIFGMAGIATSLGSSTKLFYSAIDYADGESLEKRNDLIGADIGTETVKTLKVALRPHNSVHLTRDACDLDRYLKRSAP